MEGPSIVIACEELKPFFGKKPKVAGSFKDLNGKPFTTALSWGKHLLLKFTETDLRIHFLMFGSYRINNPRENRIPKLELKFKNDTVYFYSCAIRRLESKISELYDWRTDTMSKEWKPALAFRKLKLQPKTFVCDALMDQTIFSGVGNIIKNEVLWILRLHPETKLGTLKDTELKALVRETRGYCLQFYKWKKENVLKRNWKIFRKKTCPGCKRKITPKPTGIGERRSFYCPRCQPRR